MTIFDYTKLNSDIINQILIAILKKDSAFLINHKNKKLSKKQVNTINFLYKKYQENWPLPYLLNVSYFYQLKLSINQNVLIPRPETEILVDKVIETIKENKNNEAINILDIGCGSGAIIINLAYNFKNNKKLKFIASDISRSALRIAKDNAKNYKLKTRIKFIQSDLLNNINLNKKKLIICANLPYLNKEEILHKSLKKEPKLALYGGKDGLKFYKILLIQIKSLNNIKNISVFFEINPQQNISLKKIIKYHFPEAIIRSHKDLRRKIRFIEININS